MRPCTKTNRCRPDCYFLAATTSRIVWVISEFGGTSARILGLEAAGSETARIRALRGVEEKDRCSDCVRKLSATLFL